MTNSDIVELRMLGVLEARRGDTPLSLGGAKQRAVLAALLLHVDEVVPTATVIDEVWGDEPPPSAAHALEVYVSRLRRVLAASELQLVRRGFGYAAVLGGAVLDAREFERLADEAERAAAADDDEGAARAAAGALALWRGPALADVALGPAGRSEATRLEERRLRTLEVRFDAELALGRHEHAVGELQAVVGRNPYRERVVSQLMLALYRCGRQADALDVYEQTRRRLDDELGLQPSAELQQLAARMVRQEPDLTSRAGRTLPAEPRPVQRRTGRLTGLVLVGAAATAVMALSASGGAPDPATHAGSVPGRVALVLPAHPAESAFDESRENSRITSTTASFTGSAVRHHLTATTLAIDEVAPDESDATRLLRQIEGGRFDLVVLPGDRAAARLVAPLVRALPETRFVFLDTTLGELSLVGVRNASAVRFAAEEPARLAGYATGLSLPHLVDGSAGDRAVAVVAGAPDVETRRMVAWFRRGVHEASSGVRVRVTYADETWDPTPCERAANEQIDAGAEVLFVVAGRCGTGAAAVARSRGVWVVGEDEFGLNDRPWILATIWKDWQRGPGDAIDAFVEGTLPAGADLVLRLGNRYAMGTGMSDAIPQPIQSRVMALCSRMRARAQRAVQ